VVHDAVGTPYFEVTPALQLPGHPNVFALGDVSTLTPKMAGAGRREAQLAAENIRALIEGGRLKTHEPAPDVSLSRSLLG
jgi:apoptosis-inducing factor 2